MNSSAYKKNQLKFLCAILGCKPEELEYIIPHIDEYYIEWFEKKRNKATGDYKKYTDGTIKQRAIRPSIKRLKSIQSAIKNKILSVIELPANVHGGVKKKSNISNAKPHQGKKYQFTTDLQEFYPTIKSKQVYSAFLSLNYSNHIAHWLTKLTTWKHELPQGTPTSTHIANLVFLKTDGKLIEFCKTHDLTYTRYVDDLTFSSDTDFKPFLNEILGIIIADGYNVSYRKTNYKYGQTITGIVVNNNYIDAPQMIKDKAALETNPDDNNKPYTSYLTAIRSTNKKSCK
jgi:RNA-directed DNA polymerase